MAGAGGRPPKPLQLVQGHRTKEEKEIRAKAESELLTGITMKESPEVKASPIAHKEFTRIRRLLKSIKKDDDLYGNIINTHCLLVSEIKEMESTRAQFVKTLTEFEDRAADEKTSFTEQVKIKMSLQGQILSLDKLLMAKRKMILDISKENIMTIQSALRSIPKTPEEGKGKSAMAAFLNRKKAGSNAT